MVILNLGARHFTFTFDEGNMIAPNGVQMINIKSQAPKVVISIDSLLNLLVTLIFLSVVVGFHHVHSIYFDISTLVVKIS
jgi:hypothetical protein